LAIKALIKKTEDENWKKKLVSIVSEKKIKRKASDIAPLSSSMKNH
jgi:hypothetical protein